MVASQVRWQREVGQPLHINPQRPCLLLYFRNGCRVTLYEKEESCGGHTLTDRTSPYPVDLGFQVRPTDHTPRLMGCNQAGLTLQTRCMPTYAASCCIILYMMAHCPQVRWRNSTSPPALQVYNLSTYPHFVGFLECLGVDTQPSDMSFALSMDEGKLEWGSDNLDTIFAQRSNLASPSFLAMLKDVVRFGKEAPKVRRSPPAIWGSRGKQ